MGYTGTIGLQYGTCEAASAQLETAARCAQDDAAILSSALSCAHEASGAVSSAIGAVNSAASNMQAFSAQVRSYVTGVQDYDEEFAKALEEGDDFWGGVLDVLQTGLDLAGLIPGIGEAFDLANAGIYTLRGDAVNAGLSLLACVPIGGQAATAAKLGKKVIGKVAKEVAEEAVEKVAKEGAEILVKNADEIAQVGGKGAGDVIEGGKKTVKVNGKAVTIDNSTFDPKLIDKQGRTNIQRMEQSLAPIGTDGKSVNIHHIDQTNNGPVMEITASMHRQNYSNLHANIGQTPSQINRVEFSNWRKSYWEWRSGNLK